MNQKLLVLAISLLFTSASIAQITANQVDDFNDNTTMGWFEAGASPNPPVNIPTGGPDGSNYLSDAATGTGGPGSRMVMRNVTQWIGDYTTEGVVAIRFDARVIGNDLTFRVAMNGAGGPISTTNGVFVAAGGGWTTVNIPIQAANMQTVTSNVGTGFDVAATLADVFELRILSNTSPSYAGQSVAATMEIDNIIAATTLSIDDLAVEADFKMSPNPGSGIVNLRVPQQITSFNVQVFDILGKRIYEESISNSEGYMDVSNWNNGVYLVRISNDQFTQTKRFVKQ